MTLALNRCVIGDCRQVLPTLPDGVFACCISSPPYWGLRDYGHADQIGLESTPDEYVAQLVGVFREVRRVLRDDGTLWLNLGDSYAGSWGAQSREHAGKHAPNVSALSANQAKAAQIRSSGTGSLARTPGLKPKDLVGIPWRVAFALQADGWYLRSDIIWHKPNPMPESVRDRPTKAHEYVFLLAKSERYHFDADAVRQPLSAVSLSKIETFHRSGARSGVRSKTLAPTRNDCGGTLDRQGRGVGGEMMARLGGSNVRTVWTIATSPYDGAHFATMPPALVQRCILAGCPMGAAVLDPFFGSGTVGQVAEQLGRQWLGCELNPEYGKLIAARTAQSGLQFAGGEP